MTGTSIDRLSAEDLSHLATDVGTVPMQVGAVLVLANGAWSGDAEACRLFAERVGRVPRLRQRLVRTAPGCGRPVWLEDAGFDIRHHVRVISCPPPGDERAMLDLAATLVTSRLSRARPQWSATFVTGLGDGSVALVLALHHVLADGIGGLAMLASLLDGPGPAPAGRPAPAALPWARIARDAWTARLSVLRRPIRHLRRLRDGLAELGSPGSVHAARCSLNRPTGPRRRLAVVRTDLDRVHDVAHRLGASVNDVVLTAVTGALHALLRNRGERVGELAVTIPVSGRRAASAEHSGNRVGTMPVMLPAGGAAMDRLEKIAAITQARKATVPGSSAAVMGPFVRALAAVGVLRWFMNHQHVVNTFVTDLRGPSSRLTLHGSAIREIIPVSGIAGNVTVAFAALSYAGTLTVTVIADPDQLPDLPFLAHRLQAELDALAGAVTVLGGGAAQEARPDRL